MKTNMEFFAILYGYFLSALIQKLCVNSIVPDQTASKEEAV